MTLPGELSQSIDYGRRNDRNGRFTATRRLFGTRHNVNVGCHWRVFDIGWSKAVPVALFDAAILQCYGAFWHQLRHPESYATLHLAFNRQRIYSEARIDGDRRPVNSRSSVFD